MKLEGPSRYKVTFDREKYSAESSDGRPHFCGIANTSLWKLYVVTIDAKPVYVGTTKQRMANRLRGGFTADGAHGYHGYAFFRQHPGGQAYFYVWCLEGATIERAKIEIETIEAEVVFLIRQAGQWPRFQTEIHFHQSTDHHRELASEVCRQILT